MYKKLITAFLLFNTTTTLCSNKKVIEIFPTKSGIWHAKIDGRLIMEYNPVGPAISFCYIPELGVDEECATKIEERIKFAIKNSK